MEIISKSITVMNQMTDYEQQIYDLIYEWWDIIFDINPPPVDRNGEYIDKNATIVDLVKSITALQALDKLYQENDHGMRQLANE